MEAKIKLKGKVEPIIYKGDRIDVLDLTLKGVEYTQIRYFRNGLSKSELIDKKIIQKISVE